jgi:polar amino acid transport system substrate-binding protein
MAKEARRAYLRRNQFTGMNNNRVLNIVIAAIVAALVAFGTIKFTGGGTGGQRQGAANVGTLEKALSSGVIRCGYVPYPPGLIKDPNSGQISGIFPEVLEKAAENLGLKVEWAEEVGWGTMVEGLKAGRYDVIGSPVWPTSERVAVADFTVPVYFGGIEVFVRADDTRFDSDLGILNNPDFKIATIEGEAAATVAEQDFPKAGRVSLPQMTDLSQLILNVVDGKADITFVDPVIAKQFMDQNPGKIKPLAPGVPIRLYPNVLMLNQSDYPFRRVLDLELANLQNNGFVDKIITKYEPYPNAFYRNAKPIR